MGNRDLILKLTNVIRYVLIALIVLTLASWALPYFKMDMSMARRSIKETCSLWSYIGMPTNFPQMEAYYKDMELVQGFRFMTMAILSVPLVMLISGVIGIIGCACKKGILTALFPLIFGAYGTYGYLTDTFLGLYAYSYSYIIQLVLTALTLVASIVSVVLNIMEMKSRPADYYLPTADF